MLSGLERRKPLAPTARRAGWVGCNILLDKIPVHARISVVNEGTPQTSQQVRASYNRLRPLEKLEVEKHGWTLDVLQVVQSLGKIEFTLADVYAHADALAKLHPNNAHVRDKILSNSKFSGTSDSSNSSAAALILWAMPDIAFEKRWIFLNCIATDSFDVLAYERSFLGHRSYLGITNQDVRTFNKVAR